jgi:hypothetical protein
MPSRNIKKQIMDLLGKSPSVSYNPNVILSLKKNLIFNPQTVIAFINGMA